MENTSSEEKPRLTPPPLPRVPPPLAAPLSERDAQRKLRKEIAGFMIFMGLILAGAIWAFSTQVRHGANVVRGVDLNAVTGQAIIAVAVLYVLTGILFALIPHKIFIWLGIAWSVLLLVTYSGFLFIASGEVPINLMTFAFIAIPILLWQRGRKFKGIPPAA